MNLFHLIWLALLIIAFIISIWIKKGVMWLCPLSFSLLMAYQAIINEWEAFIFPFIGVVFFISLMGLIHDCLEGEFV